MDVSFACEAVVDNDDLYPVSGTKFLNHDSTHRAKWRHEYAVATQECDEFVGGGNELPRHERNAQEGTKYLASSNSQVLRQKTRHVGSEWDRIRTEIRTENTEQV